MPSRLGQNFLINRVIARRIVALLDFRPGEAVIEIGSGQGALTRLILERLPRVNSKIIAIEKDAALADQLREELSDQGSNIEIIEGDVLKKIGGIVNKLAGQPYRIIGNIPYYITGQILRVLSELTAKPKQIVLMVQKEVAQRIISKPPAMNLLAAITQLWSSPKIALYVSKGNFRPAPKVDSAVIILNPKDKADLNEVSNLIGFFKIIFKQPRKTLFNNLRSGLKESPEKIENSLRALGYNEKTRANEFSVSDLEKLHQELTKG